MSGQCTGWVLRHGPKDRAMRAVLITIADAANRDGEHADAGVAAMIEGSGYSRATVYRSLAKLEEEGWVIQERPSSGPGNVASYTVVMGPRRPANGSHGDTYSDANGSQKGLVKVAPGDTHLAGDTAYRENVSNGSTSDASGAGPDNPEIERLCTLLADLVEANGSKRPNITKAWRVECDRMLRLDGRTPERIERAIRWCQANSFWRGNVMSMPKLREKFDQLRHAAIREQQGNGGRNATDDAIDEWARRKGLQP